MLEVLVKLVLLVVFIWIAARVGKNPLRVEHGWPGARLTRKPKR